MNHSYLRYECADAFSLLCSAGSSKKAPPSNQVLLAATNSTSLKSFKNNNNDSTIVFTTAASHVLGTLVKQGRVVLKLGHREPCVTGGTGLALNTDEVVCIAINNNSSISSSSSSTSKLTLASGWMDGSIRVMTIDLPDDLNCHDALIHSLLDTTTTSPDLVTREPLILKGHNTAIRCLDLTSTLLASGGNDGTVVVWDLIAETGLFRLLGHNAAITQVKLIHHHYYKSTSSFTTNDNQTAPTHLITTSLDSLSKLWDLQQQCCIQTIASHANGGPIWCADTLLRTASATTTNNDAGQSRFLTGSADGQVRVWNIQDTTTNNNNNNNDKKNKQKPERQMESKNDENMEIQKEETNKEELECRYMGALGVPANVVTSQERVVSIQHHYYRTSIGGGAKRLYLGILRHNSKQVDIYARRSLMETKKRQQRRLKRRREKQNKQKSNNDAVVESKRGFMDDPIEKEDNDKKKQQEMEDDDDYIQNIQASDEFDYVGTVRASHKIRAFVFLPSSPGSRGGKQSTNNQDEKTTVKVACALSTNALEVHSTMSNTAAEEEEKSKQNEKKKRLEFTKTSLLDMYGHPTGIRSMALSSDDVIACTISKHVMKLWNIASRSCISSTTLALTESSTKKKNDVQTLFGLCVGFLPGNTHVVVGTREGYLLVLDCASGSVVFQQKAHDGAIWSLDVKRPATTRQEHSTFGQQLQDEEDSRAMISVVTGSADKLVKFWNVEAQEDEDEDNEATKTQNIGHPMLVHSRTLEMPDDVVKVQYSYNTDPTKRLVFCSTLDNTIKVFFDDSLKFFLSLYGHSLPALALDASDDDMLLATGSADKTIKIWGLDFGDTHRTLYGHDDAISDLKFIPRTHYFFSSSKDGTVRYWDADRFQQILILRGHCAEVNCLAVARTTGAFCLSSGMDRQVRIWERTQDVVFLEEERERELEQIWDRVDQDVDEREARGTEAILQNKMKNDNNNNGEPNPDDDDDAQPQSEAAVKKSVLSVSSGDRIMEALERADGEKKERAKGTRPNPLLFGHDPAGYVLWILQSIRSSELEQSLLILPLGHVERLVYYLIVLLRGKRGVELCARVAIFLTRIHQRQLIGAKSMSVPLGEMRRLLRLRLSEARDVVGFNLAALRAVARVDAERKLSISSMDNDKVDDIWAGMGLGSTTAAALEGRGGKRKR